MKLTKTEIDKARRQSDGGDRYVLWDDDLPGFGLRLSPKTGRASFVLFYRTATGQKRLTTLGSYGVLTLHTARDKARRLFADVLEGGDPQAEREQARRGSNVKELVDAYIERHAKPHKKTWLRDKQRLERHVLPVWGARKAESITRADVATLHHKIGKATPYEANRVREVLRKMFNLAERWGFVPDDFKNPAVGLDRFKETKRDRWVKPDELPRLFEAIKAEPNPFIQAAIKLYLLTGLRRTELLSARWENLDFERKELYLPDTKAGAPREVHLSAPAIQILSELPHEQGNPLIFPGPRGARKKKAGADGEKRREPCPVTIGKAWERIRKQAGLPDVRLHDLRRTVGSWLAVGGESLIIIAGVLGHTSLSATQIYARLSETPVRGALEQYGAKIQAIMEGKPPAEIKRLKSG